MEMIAIVGILAIGYMLYKLFNGFTAHKKFETVFHNGEKTTLNKIFTQICHELKIPTSMVLKISPALWTASMDIRKEHLGSGSPYDAIVAYFAADVCVAYADEKEKRGESSLLERTCIFSFKAYADLISEEYGQKINK